jgi:hypothetical protein
VFTVRAGLRTSVLCAILVAGCAASREEGPKTVPLEGKLVMTKGGTVKDLVDRSITVQFQPVEQPEVQAFGELLEDGTFSMVTQFETGGKRGVVPGKHRVRLNADETSARFVAPKFLDFNTSGLTVTAPSDKEVVLEVWK